jgi:hypothetical protein
VKYVWLTSNRPESTKIILTGRAEAINDCIGEERAGRAAGKTVITAPDGGSFRAGKT